MKNFLFDDIFLKKIYNSKNKEIFIKITLLNFKEEPVEMIEGVVSTGSLNIDGNSAVRRTCSLTILSNDKHKWDIGNKFKLEIGLKNLIDKSYPDLIWFQQGIFVLTAFDISLATNNYSISISGRDKMCLLNGDLGGNLTSSVDFGVIEDYNTTTNEISYTKVLIKDIIKEAVHTYGNESYENIVIKDLDEISIELLQYRGDRPFYLLYDYVNNSYVNFITKQDMNCYVEVDGNEIPATIATIEDEEVGGQYDTRVEDLSGASGSPVYLSKDDKRTEYRVAKITSGQTVGYRLTDLTYAGDLIGNIGDSLTSILDKITKMLGTYEYFYNIYGQFVFQRKKNYVNTLWTGETKTTDDTYINIRDYSEFSYIFEHNELLTSIKNNPILNNLKNDFSIWGTRLSASGIELPIHYRYAIDKRPEKYTSLIDNITYLYPDEYDWRELIYRMALDYHKYHKEEDFLFRIAEKNPHFIMGKTGYEQYYTDLLGFWRELYNPEPSEDERDNYDEITYWNKNIDKYPDQLNFWFDFFPDNTTLDKYSTKEIGDRTKVINDNTIKAIYFQKVPNLIFTESGFNEDIDLGGYLKVQASSNMLNLLTISAQGKSAKEVLDDLLYQHLYFSEAINISSIPIYHLEPNTKIKIQDKISEVSGEYILSRITIPLTYNGIMSITGNKIPERVI